MSKPILGVRLSTLDGKRGRAEALFDTGSFFTIIRSDAFPKGGNRIHLPKPETLGTAGQKGGVTVTDQSILLVHIGKKLIRSPVHISPDLKRQMIIGAGAMQEWDISIRNRNGKTKVIVGRDLRDPEITEVD